jgi:hypothetical protein
MNPGETITNLDENFLFLLDLIKNHQHTFYERPDQDVLSRSWINKLCIEKYEGIDQKRNRNLYMCKLLACMQARKLSGPFLQRPKPDELKQWPQVLPMLKEPQWVKDLAAESAAANYMGGKDYRTYIATKELDRGRGMCALLSVSIADEGKEPEWYQISRYPGLRYLDVALGVVKDNLPPPPLPIKVPAPPKPRTPTKSPLATPLPSAIRRKSKPGLKFYIEPKTPKVDAVEEIVDLEEEKSPVAVPLHKTPSAIRRKSGLKFYIEPKTPKVGAFGELLDLEEEIASLDAEYSKPKSPYKEKSELKATSRSIQEIERELAKIKATHAQDLLARQLKAPTPKKEYKLEMPTESNMPARLRLQPMKVPGQQSGIQRPTVFKNYKKL